MQRRMMGNDAMGNGNDHFGIHDENDFCARRGCKVHELDSARVREAAHAYPFDEGADYEIEGKEW
jgi:hypothetical protein